MHRPPAGTDAEAMTPAADSPARLARRALLRRRRTEVVVTAATGAVLVALGARLGTGTAVVAAALAVAATVGAVWRAAADRRRFDRALEAAAARTRRESPRRARRLPRSG